jgi:hypothetical protein
MADSPDARKPMLDHHNSSAIKFMHHGLPRPVDPTPDVRPWASQAAQDVYTEFARHVEKLMDQNEKLEPFIARADEIAVRLATQ